MNKLFLLLIVFTLSVSLTGSVFAAIPKQTTSTKAKVEYQLPYPGILPDNPLYFLKAGRDKLMDFLIVEPVRKTEFYILQADKRLGMAMMLLDKGSTTLAETTLSKGQTYMDKAVSTIVNAKAGGRDVPGYAVERLTLSLAKHAEVLGEKAAAATDPAKAFLSAAMIKVNTFQTELEKLK